MSVAIPPGDATRLRGMLALAEHASNPSEGERMAALAAAERLLQRHGLTLRDLPGSAPAAAPAWRETLRACLQRPSKLSPWETKFLASLGGFRRPSSRQIEVLSGIAQRLGVQGCAP